jgi:hypothetical protein
MGKGLVNEPAHSGAGTEAMKLRRCVWWYVAATIYVAASLSAVPYIERFFSPFPTHVFGGHQ